MPTAYLIIAGVFAVIAVGIAIAMSGCSTTRSTTATIRSKTFVDASSYRPYAHGPADRSFRTNAPITMAAHYLFDLDAEDAPVPIIAYRNQLAGEKFQIGQRVTITYQLKSIPPFWKKAYVTEMEPLDSPAPPSAAKP